MYAFIDVIFNNNLFIFSFNKKKICSKIIEDNIFINEVINFFNENDLLFINGAMYLFHLPISVTWLFFLTRPKSSFCINPSLL